MGYQILITDAYGMEYKSDRWMGYDRHFRQISVSQLGRHWGSIDPTLWSLAFTAWTSQNHTMHTLLQFVSLLT